MKYTTRNKTSIRFIAFNYFLSILKSFLISEINQWSGVEGNNDVRLLKMA